MTFEDPFLVARMAMALIERLPQRDAGCVVLVSSALAGEGKSFIAGMLARELAAQADGELVLLVEAAFTSPRTSALRFGGAAKPKDSQFQDSRSHDATGRSNGGFAHLLSHGELQPDALRSTETPRLMRLPPGEWAGAAAGASRAQWLFQPRAVQRALQLLRPRFALTVVDGAPLAECGALAQEADSVVLVVNARRTPRHAIDQAMAAARVDPARMAGVVLNRHVSELPRWLGGR